MTERVRAWEEAIILPTYPAPAADKNPMFLDKRVYQGSSGKVYPNAFTDRVSDVKEDKTYQAVYLENEYIRLMILPEIGGRIHIGQDKTNGYDFFYRQNVIKPALVGLLGPWISGGVEFNWPQHHRPSTFMPVEHSIEEHDDGSRTVWLSEHEPMNRMKGTVGICLHPGKAIVEAKVRLYNRTPFVQTFLWWANVGIRVHDQYQAFFPPDVTFVADHAKRAVSWYPVARNFYYGVDYTSGVDISWYKNIPVPTSYMVTKSDYDFFGGYDHLRSAGVVHVANRHIAPGKKLWTWGNAEFGYAWDRELTDTGGPYIELMAGVYTDNQPDFSWLQPYETRSFSQFWYPIQEIGPAKNANRLVAVNLGQNGNTCKVGVCATEPLLLTVVLTAAAQTVLERRADIAPGKPFVETVEASGSELLLRVLDAHGNELIRYRPEALIGNELPSPAIEPPPPAEIESNDELYLTGLHLEQYRHATRYAEAYWEEALRRDPQDARCNNAMGLLHLRRGSFAKAEQYFRTAIARLTGRNPNPYDGEPHYNLGLTLKFQGRLDEAYAAFYKAAWSQPWQSAAYYGIATIDCKRGDRASALEHVDFSLRTNADNPKALHLKAVLTLPNRDREGASQPFDAQTCLDHAFDYAEAGLLKDAANLIERFIQQTGAEHPMLLYALAHFDPKQDLRRASEASPDYCFPARLEEMLILESALEINPDDAKAHYYLGNLMYDKHRRDEAIDHWEQSCRLDPSFSIPWRNLGIAYFNIRGDAARAMDCYEAACAANPNDARLLYEIDQLRKRTGTTPEDRLARLEQRRDLLNQRDDLTAELVTLYNQTGQSAQALEILAGRRFHPWEGGEGLVSGQYVMAHFLLGRECLSNGHPEAALEHLDAARHYPHNLGEGKHPLTPETHLDYYTGVAHAKLGRYDEAAAAWRTAAESRTAAGPFAYYRALALRSLDRENDAVKALRELLESAERQINTEVKIDYFATSLPDFLLFEDDLQKRNRIECLFMRGLARLGLHRTAEAATDLSEALRLDRNHLWARTELGRIETRVEEVIAR
jgi:tetratricopeptide (TPR) repeat protein